MKIETKYSVGDIVKHQFQTPSERFMHGLEVLELQSQTCYAGTQVFYLCRHIVFHKMNDKWKDATEIHWSIAHEYGSSDNQTGYRKYREDELTVLDEGFLSLLEIKEST